MASIASNSACRVPFLSSFVRLLPVATISPSRTTTHPTGTSHRRSARSASTSAARIHRSSDELQGPPGSDEGEDEGSAAPAGPGEDESAAHGDAIARAPERVARSERERKEAARRGF